MQREFGSGKKTIRAIGKAQRGGGAVPYKTPAWSK